MKDWEQIEREQQELADAECEKVWQEFWVADAYDGREPTMQEIKRELSDFHMVMTEVRKVYSHLTGGKISKVTTKAEVVIDMVEEHYEKYYESVYDDHDPFRG